MLQYAGQLEARRDARLCAAQLWHFSELGEEQEQFQEYSCILHNDLFYKEILSAAGPRHPQDGTGRLTLLPLGPFLIFLVFFQQKNEKIPA